MKFVRVSTVAAVTAVILSGTMLLSTSQKVQKAERQLSVLSKEKNREGEAIRVLRAEWDYLNRPDRLEALATRYLGMKEPDLAAVTDNTARLDAPVAQAVDLLRRPPQSPLAQSAVYHASAPAPSASQQKNFDAVVHALNVGNVP